MRTPRTRDLQYITIFYLPLYSTMGLDSKCLSSYIHRKVWQRGAMESICCKRVERNCSPGYFVKKCTYDNDEDECIPCGYGKWLGDETNSTYPFPCIDFSCPTGSDMINFIPTVGCGRPCICNTSKGFYNLDGCNCMATKRDCENGTKLALNGSCIDDSISDPFKDFKLPNWIPIHHIITEYPAEPMTPSPNKNITFRETPNGEMTTQFKKRNNSVTTPLPDLQKPQSPTSYEFEWKLVITIIIILAVLTLGIGILISALRTRCWKRREAIPQPMTPTEPNTPTEDYPLTEVKTLADSGISLTSIKDEGDEPLLNQAQQRPVGQAARFMRPEEETTLVAETVSDTDSHTTNFVAPSGSRREYMM